MFPYPDTQPTRRGEQVIGFAISLHIAIELGCPQSKHSTYAARKNRIDLLLNEDVDGLPVRVRELVVKAEELLSDAAVRAALIDRSSARTRKISKIFGDEQLAKARIELRIQEQDAKARLAAPEILSKMAERAIRGNLGLLTFSWVV